MPRDGSFFPQPWTYCELLRELSHPESSLRHQLEWCPGAHMKSSPQDPIQRPEADETHFCGAISLVRERPAVESRSPRKGKRKRNHGFGLGHPCRKLSNMAQHQKTRSRSRLKPHRTSPPRALFRTTGVQVHRKPKRRS
jgi:hypothetical protein